VIEVNVKNIGDITLKDVVSGEKIYVSIKAHDRYIGIVLSVEHNGDVEAFVSAEDAQKIIRWLQESVQKISEKITT
jgi:hypothetical protein